MSNIFVVRLSGLIAVCEPSAGKMVAMGVSPLDHKPSLVFPLSKLGEPDPPHATPAHRVVEDPRGYFWGIVDLEGCRLEILPDGEHLDVFDHELLRPGACEIERVAPRHGRIDPDLLASGPQSDRVNMWLTLGTGRTYVREGDLAQSDKIEFEPDNGVGRVQFSETLQNEFDNDAVYIEVAIRRRNEESRLRLDPAARIAVGNHPEGRGHGGHHFLKYYDLAASPPHRDERPMPKPIEEPGEPDRRSGSSGCIPSVFER